MYSLAICTTASIVFSAAIVKSKLEELIILLGLAALKLGGIIFSLALFSSISLSFRELVSNAN